MPCFHVGLTEDQYVQRRLIGNLFAKQGIETLHRQGVGLEALPKHWGWIGRERSAASAVRSLGFMA